MTTPHTAVSRRAFMAGAVAAGIGTGLSAASAPVAEASGATGRPNIVFVLADQWRGQAVGYAGDVNAHTPRLNALAGESVRFTQAVSAQPVCTPYRACLLTGQYPLTHGVFMNDVQLNPEANTLAKVLGAEGYDTAYIGKWHLDGRGRSSFIPRERRQGFEYWRALECTHDYNNSLYYGDDPEPRHWEGYDAIAQTLDAQRYIRSRNRETPFLLALSWGPPHDPYHTAPEKYRAMIDKNAITLRGNVPEDWSERAIDMLSGYYAHIAALDECVGTLLDTLDECGIADNTLFVFTSDHGDMLGSHGARNKQQPYAESIMTPFLLRYPDALGRQGRDFGALFNTPDIMPTLLGLAGASACDACEGADFSAALRAGDAPEVDSAFLLCPAPFGQWARHHGGREYRGVYTGAYTYTRDLNGPSLLFDNEADPWQLHNLVEDAGYAHVRRRLDGQLDDWLARTNDRFLPAADHLAQWNYEVDDTGTVPYSP